MNLTDVLPCSAEELFKIQHEHSESKSDTTARRLRLKPFQDAFMMCLYKCGPLTDDPKQEYCIHMSALALIDIMIEEYSKKSAV